jgi:hypothetical protein
MIDNYKISSYSISYSGAQRHKFIVHSTRKVYASEQPRIIPKVSPFRHQRRIYELDSLQGDIRKIKPPSFDGERENEDNVEA